MCLVCLDSTRMLMLSHKLDSIYCANRDGFCKASHNLVYKHDTFTYVRASAVQEIILSQYFEILAKLKQINIL